jgi:putative dehydrogenase
MVGFPLMGGDDGRCGISLRAIGQSKRDSAIIVGSGVANALRRIRRERGVSAVVRPASQADALPALPLAGRTVAVIGLGSMGGGMAASLQRAGAKVRGYDRSPEALARLSGLGGVAAHSARHAVDGAEAVLCVVVNAEQTGQLLFGEHGCLEHMRAGALFISCATMSPASARLLGARVQTSGRLFLDAPMSGGAARAAEGALSMLASGSPAAFAAADPILAALAASVHRLGDEAGQAAAFKMVNQLLAGVHIAAAAEAMAFAVREGLDLGDVYRVITQSAGNSWMFENRMQHVLDGDYAPRSATSIFVKDLGIVLEMGRDSDFPLPLATTALQLFLMTAAVGMDRDDDASVVRLYARLAGLELPPIRASAPDPQPAPAA